MPKSKRQRVKHYRLTLRDVLQAHEQALTFGGLAGVRSLALIESAIGRPYCGYYRTISKKAAALTQSLAKNHGFIDGNKRTTLIAVTLLITRSKYQLIAVKNDIVKEVENMILDVVEDRMSFEHAEAWFRAHIRKESWIRTLWRPKKAILR